jgi:TPR repeat protein
MNTGALTTAYFNICEIYLRVQSLTRGSEQIEWMSRLHAAWEMCFHSLMKAADSPNREIWYALGDAFCTGRGTQRDRSEAIKWFQRAAEAGHTRGMARLGSCLQWPESTADMPAALHWFRKAAEAGEPWGMVSLGFCYRDGHGVPSDDQAALHWFTRAAEAGDRHSLGYVGRLYAYQLGSPRQAFEWLNRAAEAGLTDSYIELAWLCDNPKTEVYNPTEAAKWYAMVINKNRGNASRAMLALARMCRDGRGVPRSQGMAREWLLKLIKITREKSSEHKKAIKLLREMQSDLL